MAVSVRMDAVLEQELERRARQLGVSKSQFIIDAVERALGRRDPHAVLRQVEQRYGLHSDAADPAVLVAHAPAPAPPPRNAAAVRAALQAKHDAEMRDWLAYQAARRRGQDWQPDEPGAGGAAGAA